MALKFARRPKFDEFENFKDAWRRLQCYRVYDSHLVSRASSEKYNTQMQKHTLHLLDKLEDLENRYYTKVAATCASQSLEDEFVVNRLLLKNSQDQLKALTSLQDSQLRARAMQSGQYNQYNRADHQYNYLQQNQYGGQKSASSSTHSKPSHHPANHQAYSRMPHEQPNLNPSSNRQALDSLYRGL